MHTVVSRVKNICGDSFYSAIIGSMSENETDLLLVGSEEIPLRQKLQSLSRLLEELVNEGSVIVKHEHRKYCHSDRIIHVLFYPSKRHLVEWELPSFVAYVNDRAIWISRSPVGLAFEYRNYRLREINAPRRSIIDIQFLSYQELACTYMIYAIAETNFVTTETLIENLLYVARFSITEYFVNQLDPDEPIEFWDWTEFLSYLSSIEEFRVLTELFKQLRNSELSLSRFYLSKMYIEFIVFLEERNLQSLISCLKERIKC